MYCLVGVTLTHENKIILGNGGLRVKDLNIIYHNYYLVFFVDKLKYNHSYVSTDTKHKEMLVVVCCECIPHCCCKQHFVGRTFLDYKFTTTSIPIVCQTNTNIYLQKLCNAIVSKATISLKHFLTIKM